MSGGISEEPKMTPTSLWNGFVMAAALLVAASGGCERSKPEPQTEPKQDRPAKPPPGQNRVGRPDTGDTVMALKIESSAFAHNEPIPKQFTGDGRDLSPPLSWANLPEGTKELALICDDPDAPRPQPWVHWVIYKIPATAGNLPENVAKTVTPAEPAGALQGENSWGKIGYGGPAPPRGHGVHHYHFKLYALDAPLDVAPGLTKERLLAAMEGHLIAQGELVGTYQR
jgi:Raf kinase inhibitor-like YbhB/YbcL family protein